MTEPGGRGSEPPGELPPRNERSARGFASDGVLLVDKPAGPTSHDVVARVRRGLPRGVKVGHAGTLDPFATGLLLVLLGRATRVQQYLMGLPKAYETVARLGWTSSTGDVEGELVETGRVPPAGAALPVGRLRQRPPAFSAVKIGGKRAYALARAGEAVEVPEREVEVRRFEELWRSGDRAGYVIHCSSGTYVRSLIADLPGGDAYCLELRRTAIGPFDVAEAGEEPLSLGDALRRVLAVVELDEETAWRAGHGQRVAIEQPAPLGEALLVDPAGEPVCVAEIHDGVGRPRVGFRA
jgi:tRNA pseudouridine55 synthase